MSGATGLNGGPGATGATGASGFQGVPGYTGSVGFTGLPGNPGPQGNPGFAGPIGSPGATGQTGELLLLFGGVTVVKDVIYYRCYYIFPFSPIPAQNSTTFGTCWEVRYICKCTSKILGLFYKNWGPTNAYFG